MSYRAFKHLLGETSLERKCRWLLGTGVLVLMAASFYVYADQTESLAYDQLAHTGRTLVPPYVAQLHIADPELKKAMAEFTQKSEDAWADDLKDLKDYKYRLFKRDYVLPERAPHVEALAVMTKFRDNPEITEDTVARPRESVFLYYGAVRASSSCVGCHRSAELMARFAGPREPGTPPPQADPNLKEGDLMAAVAVRLSTKTIEAGFHQNRAILISFAFGTTVLVLVGIYTVIRYVIVKPVKHLKGVSDAIAAGHLNVRSEIQTGDEFEDLSDAFNRMLRNLTHMQDRNKALIADLDRKVDELARVNMALFESDRLKGDFLHTMSHELRTPLNSVIGFSEVLLNADNLTEKQHRWAGNIMTSGQHLLALINDILELAKTEAGRMRVHPEDLNPADVCERAAALFRQQAEKKGIELKVVAPPDLTTVRQDAGKLGQVLSNLVSNAVKFTPEGGKVTVKAAVDGEKLVLTVTDTGVGIAPEEQELVFDKFRQASNPLTREQGGTGLGLSIVRELAKLLGGEVTLKSDLGRGSTFAVTVAAHLPDDPAAAFDLPDPAEVGERVS